jgi:serine/threonine-protein kinase
MDERSEQSKNLSGTFVGRFRILERLGSGGMGEVYLAEDSQLKRTVAIKRMSLRLSTDLQHRQRFLREAQMASRLNDPHIAAIYDVFEREGEIFLVMERVEGETLRQKFASPLRVGEFLPLAIQCAEGLASAHAQGVLHRDIKPENIMVTPGGQVKILDFGLARRLTQTEEETGFETEPGTLTGTPGYMAPEVLSGNEADARADIFSLGVVFYEVFTRSHPFRAKTNISTSSRVLYEQPPDPSTVNAAIPPDLERLMMRMLEKDPARRIASAADVAADLRAVQSSSTAPTTAVAASELMRAPSRKGRRHIVLVVAVAAVVVFAALTAVWLIRPSPRVNKTSPGAVAASGEKQVAVLPFTVLGGGAGQQAFASGLADTVTARLAQLSATHRLAVVPSSEVFSRKVNSPDMARRIFGANLVLTGSLQQAGGRIRVTYALVDTGTERQLSARTVTAAAGDPFTVEDDVASGVLDMLKVSLLPAERKTFEAKGTDKPNAYSFYLQGMGYLENYDRPENVRSAITVFQRALSIDPRYARAYAGLGQAYWHRYSETQDAQWTARGRQACDRALALDPNLAAAHICLGTVANGTGEYARGVEQFQRALSSEPTSDLAYEGLAYAFEKLGRKAEAEQTFRKAIALRPQYWAGYGWLGIFYFRYGRYDEAAQMFRQVVALAPDSFQGYYDLGGVYAQMGDFSKAVPILERSLAIRPTDSGYTNLGTAQFFLHRYREATANFERAVRMLPASYIGWRNLGDGYYWTPGMRAKASAAYRKAIELAQASLKVNPRDAYAYEIVAIAQAMTGHEQSASRAIQQALALAPADPDVSYAAAIVYTQAGDRDQGMKLLKKALAEGQSPAMARNDPALDPLHGMQGFPSN